MLTAVILAHLERTMNRVKSRVIIALLGAALAGTTLLSACGHKGPLYLPDTTKKEQKKEEAK
jgi:predicted small lipoprotein YifL